MSSTATEKPSNSTTFWRGFRAGAPFVFVVAPFALLFGVLATEAGLNVLETMAFSIVVIAGAAQFTALQLMQENAPTIIVLASALAVNLRMAMYSAALTPYLGAASLWQRATLAYFILDQSYACCMIEYEARPKMSLADRLAFFAGTVLPVVFVWYLCTYIGAAIGAQIPDTWALDFALPITFLALLAPLLRTRAHLIAAFVAVVSSLVLAGLPYNLGLLVSALIAMMAGARAELYFAKESAPV